MLVPGGSLLLPFATAHEYGAFPPVAVKGAAYATPTVPLAKDVVVIDTELVVVVPASALIATRTAGETWPLRLFLTANWTNPGSARLALWTGLLRVLPSTTVVDSSVPFQSTLLPESKLEP